MSADSPKDATAHVVDAWRRERPDLDLEPIEIWSRITRLAKYLDVARRDAFADHGLRGWEFDVLADLRRAGSPYELTPGQMTAQMLVSSGTMTNRLDHLERAGLVERRSDAADGRVTRVRLTSTGLQTVDGAMSDLLKREKAMLESLGHDDRPAVVKALTHLLAHVEA